MKIKQKAHNFSLYNTLLTLSRNLFFYKKINLPDTFETRIYLMFMHFSVMMIATKKRNGKFNQKNYDYLFFSIENNLRELGFGDVSVNKKMKDLNKVLYDILIKIESKTNKKKTFEIENKLISKYFSDLNSSQNVRYLDFQSYFTNFFKFCFELPLDNMVRDAINFKI